MIYSTTPFYAKVWKTKPAENGKYIDLQISTTERNQDGEYEDSTWFPRAIGKAVNTLKDVKAGSKGVRGDSIYVTKYKFTTPQYLDKDGNKKSSLKLVIYEAEIKNYEPNGKDEKPKEEATKPAEENSVAEEESPW